MSSLSNPSAVYSTETAVNSEERSRVRWREARRIRIVACTLIVALVALLMSRPVRAQMNWIPDAGNPINGPFAFNNVPSVLYDEDRQIWRAWYGVTPGSGAIGYAESEDGVQWQPDPPDVVLSPESGAAWESCGKWAPSVIHDPAYPSAVVDDEGEPYAYQMWYNGYDCADDGQIGYVVSHDGRNWVRPVQEPVLTTGGPGDWDRSWIHIPRVLYDEVVIGNPIESLELHRVGNLG